MALIKILYKTVLMAIAGVILITGVLTEGVERFFGKLTEYLEMAGKLLVDKSELKIGKKKKPGKYDTK